MTWSAIALEMASLLVGFIASIVSDAISERRQAAALKQLGAANAALESNDANSAAAALARDRVDDWDSLPDADRERLRDERKHYRD
ncbi:hypothetical protein [Breoghania sp.]|uniref:hypothetical protein n=1 Tax=Breoghania sp. TaxID=2065378 RepID=UPI002AA89C51|nr:hypothetical protein [Breoghania sp.]